ncbi:MAG: lysozyme [Burkholderiaceae bacterium]
MSWMSQPLVLRLTRSLGGFIKPLPVAAKRPAPDRVATGARRISDAGTRLIERFEGKHRVGGDGLIYPYYDHVGFPTQGIGRLLAREKWADLAHWPAIDEATCHAWHLEDLDRFANGVERLLPGVSLSDNEFAALVSLAFNIGLGNFGASTLVRMLRRGDSRIDCADQFLRWDKAGGKKSRGLARRREAERLLFLS